MAPGRRKGFHQILTNEPPAVDVIRDDFVVEKMNDEECLFRWEKSPEVFEIIKGVILQSGLKKDLLVRNVNAAGELVVTGGLQTRKKEIEKLRMTQVNAEKITLQTTAEKILGEGADAVCELAQPVFQKKKYVPVRKLDPLETLKLEEELSKIGCLEEKSGKTRLCKDYNVFVSTGKLSVALLKYRRQPDKLHQYLLKLALPEKILRLDGISRTGKKGCVGISTDITESITLYVNAVFKAAGGNVADINYDPEAKLKNLLDNTRRRKGKIRLMCSPPPSPLITSDNQAPVLGLDINFPPTSPTPSTSKIDPPVTPTRSALQKSAFLFNSPQSDHHNYASPKTYADLSSAAPTVEVTLPFNNF